MIFGRKGDTSVYYNRQAEVCLISEGDKLSVAKSIPDVYKNLQFSEISGIVGLAKLKLNSYIITIKSHEVMGNILGEPIARIKDYDLIPTGSSTVNSEEREYLKLLREQLDKNELFFSVNGLVDLTTNFQRQAQNGPTAGSTASEGGAGSAGGVAGAGTPEFLWNKYLADNLVAEGADPQIITPVINGYFRSEHIHFHDEYELNYILLTRKSNFRSGTRYFRRGIDNEGNVANFNETEQIIVTKDRQLLSFLQIRGSVPVYWTEINNLRYKPSLIVSSRSPIEAANKHFSKLVSNYGEVYCINLVNQKGYELPVKEGFESVVSKLAPPLDELVKYVYFDFHHECKGMKFHNANKLIPILEQLKFDDSNYFHYDYNTSKVINTQKKIVRTNCMDCLDRTNVVQSILSRWVLQKNLTVLGYLNLAIPWKQVDPNFNFIFQNFWADNADLVSKSYSSTPALKTDFTRLGKRTVLGSLKDLQNSIIRYYNNNWKDGSRQDSFDLFLGNYRPYEHLDNPFIDHRPTYVQLVPYLLGSSFIILLSLIFYPRGSFFSYRNLISLAICIYFQVRLVRFMATDSYQFVNWPSLVNLDFLSKERVVRDNKVVGVAFDVTTDFKTDSKKSI